MVVPVTIEDEERVKKLRYWNLFFLIKFADLLKETKKKKKTTRNVKQAFAMELWIIR